MLVEMGADINSVDDENKNALHLLSENNCHLKIAQYLISKKIDVNLRDEEGKTPLYFACANDKCSHDYLNLLLNNGCNDINDGLVGAASAPNFDFVNLMISKGANEFSKARKKKLI